MRKQLIIICFILLVTGITAVESCRKKSNAFKATPFPFELPSNFPVTSFYQTNTLTVEGVELGRRLFYDGKLSKDGTISCGYCHEQRAAFGTYDHDLSHGINFQHSNRNAPPLFNLGWYTSFGWDGRHNNLSAIIESHINSSIDMGETTTGVVNKLKNTANYPQLFQSAYGSTEINRERLLNALAQFVSSFISAGSRYDSVKAGKAFFTTNEQAGYNLFISKCNSCHAEPLFSDFSYRNNGLPMTVLQDKGRMSVTGNRNDSLKFRVPTLRNLFYSFPFMHDGRFIAFSQVFDHYQNGIVQSPTLDPLLTTGIPLTVAEQTALVDFLKTLGDQSFISNGRLTAPQ